MLLSAGWPYIQGTHWSSHRTSGSRYRTSGSAQGAGVSPAPHRGGGSPQGTRCPGQGTLRPVRALGPARGPHTKRAHSPLVRAGSAGGTGAFSRGGGYHVVAQPTATELHRLLRVRQLGNILENSDEFGKVGPPV